MLEPKLRPAARALDCSSTTSTFRWRRRRPRGDREDDRRRLAELAVLDGHRDARLARQGAGTADALPRPDRGLAVRLGSDPRRAVRRGGRRLCPLIEKAIGPTQLWLSAYNNDVFGYLPSARVLAKGGYETRGVVHGGPGFFLPESQDAVVAKVKELAGTGGATINTEMSDSALESRPSEVRYDDDVGGARGKSPSPSARNRRDHRP